MSDADVLELRAEWATGKWKVNDLAHIFDIPTHVVRGIVFGQTYRDVKPTERQED